MLSQKDRTTAARPTPEEQEKCNLPPEQISHYRASLSMWVIIFIILIIVILLFLMFTCPWLWVSVGTAARSLSLLLSVLAGDKMCSTRALWAWRQWSNCYHQELAAKDSLMKKVGNKTFFFFAFVFLRILDLYLCQMAHERAWCREEILTKKSLIVQVFKAEPFPFWLYIYLYSCWTVRGLCCHIFRFIMCHTFSWGTGLDCRQASPVHTLFFYEATLL